jgi:predicted glycosyltransferase
LPAGVDCLTLPALCKDERGGYHPRNLKLDLDQLLELRSRTICTTLEALQPDLFIVDKLSRGVLGELDRPLARLREIGKTTCVLGLRDVLDEPEAVRRDWRKEAGEEAIRKYYEAIWVYGDPRVYDMAKEYRLPVGIAGKIRYTGYLDQTERVKESAASDSDPLAVLGLPPGRLLLCLVGGGQDGARLAEAFSQASLPDDAVGVIVTGPYMADEVVERLQRRASRNPRLRVLRFVPEPAILVSQAERVVAMGGYNTTCEILSFRKPALLVPRVKPRLEQWIRASRMADLNLLDVVHPDDLRPDVISAWLHSPKETHRELLSHVDLDGLSRLPGMAAELLDARRSSCDLNQQQYIEVAHYASN